MVAELLLKGKEPLTEQSKKERGDSLGPSWEKEESPKAKAAARASAAAAKAKAKESGKSEARKPMPLRNNSRNGTQKNKKVMRKVKKEKRTSMPLRKQAAGTRGAGTVAKEVATTST